MNQISNVCALKSFMQVALSNLILLIGLTSVSAQTALREPGEVATAFFKSISGPNWSQHRGYSLGPPVSDFGTRSEWQNWSATRRIDWASLVSSMSQTDGDWCWVRLTARISDEYKENATLMMFEVTLKRVGLTWKVARFEEAGRAISRRLLNAKDKEDFQRILLEESDFFKSCENQAALNQLAQFNSDRPFMKGHNLIEFSKSDPVTGSAILLHLGSSERLIGELPTAAAYLEKGLTLTGNSRVFVNTSVLYGELATLELVREDYVKAKTFLRKAVETFHSSASPGPLIRIHQNIAKTIRDSGDIYSALDVFASAIQFAHDYKAESMIALLTKSLGDCYYELGEYKQAESEYQRSLASFERQSKAFPRARPNTVADWEIYLAVAKTHEITGNLADAVDLYGKACKRAQSQRNPKGTVDSCIELAELHLTANRPVAALRVYKDTIQRLLYLGEKESAVDILIAATGPMSEKSVYARRGLALLDSYKSLIETADKLSSSSRSSIELGRLSLAMAADDDELRKRILNYFSAQPAMQDMSAYAHFTAYLNSWGKGNLLRAQSEIAGARTAASNLTDVEDRTDFLRLLAYFQMLYISIEYDKQPDRALALLDDFRQREGNDRLISGLSYQFAALVRFQNINSEQDWQTELLIAPIRENCQTALNPLRETTEAADREYFSLCGELLAKVAFASGRPEEALEHLDWLGIDSMTNRAFPELRGRILYNSSRFREARLESVRTIEELENVSSPGGSIRYGNGLTDRLQRSVGLRPLYQFAVRAHLRDGSPEGALAFADRGKGQILREFQRAREIQPDPTSESRRAVALPGWFKAARIRSSTIEDKHDRIRKKVNPRPDLNTSGLKSTIEKILNGDPNVALLEYFLDENDVYLFVVTSDGTGMGSEAMTNKSIGVSVFNLGDRVPVQEEIDQFHESIRNRRVGYSDVGRRLYDRLLGPAAEIIKGKRTLIIIPDGELWRVPFQALQPSQNRFVIEDFVVNYAPSLSVLEKMASVQRKPKARTGQGKVLGVGYSSYGNEGNLVRLNDPLSGDSDKELDPLANSLNEIRRLKSIYGTANMDTAVVPRLDKAGFSRIASKYDILHLATHGILNGSKTLESGLVFGPDLSQEAGAKKLSLLTTKEIMTLNLKADLVVLSACDSANVDTSEAEGLIGLSWGFLAAGVPTVVGSQWSVEDASTSLLMEQLHSNLREKYSSKKRVKNVVGSSLRDGILSMMKLRKEYRHPYYWAPFIVIGSAD